MADEKLTITVEGKDKASGVFRKISNGLKSFATIGATGLAAVAGGTAILASRLVSLGSDAEEMQAKFDVVFGVRAAEVTTTLDNLAASVNRNRFELRGYAAQFQDTLVPMGVAEGAAAQFSTQLTQLAVDLSSFNNMPMDEAARRLQGTLVGAHENALAFGVVINENTLKAELAAQGWDTLTGAQLEAAKVQARINLLMAGTTTAQGDAIRTSESWANTQRAINAALTETATVMGSALLPVLTPLLQGFASWVQEILPQAIPIFEQFAQNLSGTIGPALTIIGDSLQRIAVAFGIVNEGASGTDTTLAVLKGTLDGIVTIIQAVAIGMNLLATGVEKVNEALTIAANLVNQVGQIGEAVGNLATLGANAAGGQTTGGATPAAVGAGAQFGGAITLNSTVNLDGQKVGEIVGQNLGQRARQNEDMGGIARP